MTTKKRLQRLGSKALGIQPGQQVQVLVYEGRVEFVPVKKLKKMRGFLRGIDTSMPRDKDRV
ncbi:AbrB family transcriptional regulator [Pelomicrobium methylotrophicum]|uniref:AbrB family transcriptional regulator n=1 Tax=Pelomicrobium methylotrophicum TaxID=2602750 RepID=A0A5C7ESP1_9PROT|nr:AbrB family transcriptional regulator [Pelomicrobium methylotrophicum]TXF09156.1 AbrB family transcriptional regulator [Pelomicrobium methylotrophicum]